MRYDDMKRMYPDIDQLLAGVSELIHKDRVAPEFALRWSGQWVCRHISKGHQQDVTDKVQQFIDAIR